VIELSVVLITKNQEWNAARLIESVLRATASISSREIILVDSISTDRTVEIARRYPISIVRLRPNQRLSPAAGRYLGYKRTRGEFVLFLDGDMELLPGWLEQALRFMRGMPNAGVMLSSKVIELPPPGPPEPLRPPDIDRTSGPTEVSRAAFVVGGAALYRRSVLEDVGTFNPYLYSDEEPELYLRIRVAGYRVLQLDFSIVRHYSVSQETPSALLGRRRRNFLLGVGQCLRYHLHTKVFWPYLKERGSWSVTAALGMIAGAGALLWSLATRDFVWFGSWTLAVCLLFACAAVRKHSLRRAFYSLFQRTLMVEGLFRGFLIEPLTPDGYPRDVEVIQETSTATLVRSKETTELNVFSSDDGERKESTTASGNRRRSAVGIRSGSVNHSQ
jgi:glycosyltransferase involved in cell wall biosynthesis